ncbi:hypothetical protein SASPL_151156 [Salvia splendens]|uniref:Uncharacterized protein n=1 Tax=Salvia splendens TaxID=180675 RepID=A0A8X8Z348_SALSN|nr:hypothetical protein SASPL_151156 [Salvia splendens]
MATTTTTTASKYEHERARDMWRRCLASAFRTALACTIVGVATLYGPAYISRHVSFPAFSYVTVILIVTDATLGDTLRGCWLALYATALGVFPGHPQPLAHRPRTPHHHHHLRGRRVYVIAFVIGGRTEPVMHPLHLAASTALGTAACVLALLLPVPCLAYRQVTENCKLYIDNASKRLKLFITAFSADDKASPKMLICQAKSLTKPANKFLHCIKSKEESMRWEREPIKFLKSYKKNPGEPLQGLETILRGMENALENCSEFPVAFMNDDAQLKHDLSCIEEKIMNQVSNMALQNSVLPQPDDDEEQNKFLQTLQSASLSLNDLPSLFFVFCLKLLHSKPSPNQTKTPKESDKENQPFLQGKRILVGAASGDKPRLIKGGDVQSRKHQSPGDSFWNSVWSDRLLRVRKLCEDKVRLSASVVHLQLFPAAEQDVRPGRGRSLRRLFGLSCSIMVDILLQPTRASALAKVQLSASLRSLHEAVEAVSAEYLSGLEERLRKLRVDVIEFGKLIEEAQAEPNFWFLPFHGACYAKLNVSLLKMVDYLYFGSQALGYFEEECRDLSSKTKVESELKVFKDVVCLWGEVS